MKNTDWIDLVRLIPDDQHNKLVVTTLTGVDLNVEIILRMEEQYIVFRGRISGITDEGRVFFVPYRQIDYMQINRQVKEAEIQADVRRKPGPVAATGSPTFGNTGVRRLRVGRLAAAESGMPGSPAGRRPAQPVRPGRRSRRRAPLSIGHRGRNSTPPPGRTGRGRRSADAAAEQHPRTAAGPTQFGRRFDHAGE